MTGGFGPSCDRGDGGVGSSGSSSRLLRPPELPPPLAFASEPERVAGGGGGGGDARRSRRWLIVLCGDGGDSKKLLPPKTVSWEHLFRPVATQHISWEVLFTHRNELLLDSLEPSHPQNASRELFFTVGNERPPRLESLSALPPSDRGTEHGSAKCEVFIVATTFAIGTVVTVIRYWHDQ